MHDIIEAMKVTQLLETLQTEWHCEKGRKSNFVDPGQASISYSFNTRLVNN